MLTHVINTGLALRLSAEIKDLCLGHVTLRTPFFTTSGKKIQGHWHTNGVISITLFTSGAFRLLLLDLPKLWHRRRCCSTGEKVGLWYTAHNLRY